METKKNSRKLGEEETQNMDDFLRISHWKEGVGMIPNMLLRTNYFTCGGYSNEKLSRGTLEIYHEAEQNGIKSIGYSGYRGTMAGAYLFYFLINETKNKLGKDKTIRERDLMISMGIEPTNTVARRIIQENFEMMARTFIEFNYKGTVCIPMLGKSYRPDDMTSTQARVYICNIPDEFAFFLDRGFSSISTEKLLLCRNQPFQARIYLYLATNKKNPYLKTEQLVSMINPNTANPNMLIKNIKRRALHSLQEKGIITGWEYKNNNTNMIEFKFKNNTFIPVPNKVEIGGIMLRRRTKAMVLKMESKIQTKSILDDCDYGKNKKEIIEIIEYWESSGLPAYRNKNDRNKSFKKAVRAIRRALTGHLYSLTIWKDADREFTLEEIKLAIDNHLKTLQPHYYPQNKEFLKKIRLNYFFLPYIHVKTDKIARPVFLQNLQHSPTMLIEPVSKEHSMYLMGKLKKVFKRDLKEFEVLDCHTFINTLGKMKVKPFKSGLYDSIDFAIEACKAFYKQNFNTKQLTSNNFVKRYYPDYLRQVGRAEMIDIRKLEG